MIARSNHAGITYVAFTATPKSKTLELFGRRPIPDQAAGPSNLPEAFHVYSMRLTAPAQRMVRHRRQEIGSKMGIARGSWNGRSPEQTWRGITLSGSFPMGCATLGFLPGYDSEAFWTACTRLAISGSRLHSFPGKNGLAIQFTRQEE